MRRNRERKRQQRSLRLEMLEGRRLLAAGIELNSGVLSITGTEKADKISIRLEDQSLVATLNKDVQTFAVADVSSIQIDALGGKDRVELDNSIMIDAIIDGGDGKDLLIGGGGNDTIFGGDDKDTLRGQDGDDELYGQGDKDKLYGGLGDDLLDGGDDKDKLYGEQGDDTLLGGDDKDKLYGGDGNDFLDGGADKDQLDGGDGDDTLLGGDDKDKLRGGAGNDTLNGQGGRDHLYGDDGDDHLDGGDDDDKLRGGRGDDFILGGSGRDKIWGDDGQDTLDGGDDNHRDHIRGGRGVDVVRHHDDDKVKEGHSYKTETEYVAPLQRVNGSLASGKGEFEIEQEHNRLEIEFEVEIEDAVPSASYDISVDGKLVGSLTMNIEGDGKLKLSSHPDDLDELPLPENFPTVTEGSRISVADEQGNVILEGTFAIKAPENS